MDNSGYETTEKTKEYYIVFGLDKKNTKVFVSENGYNPYEWRHEGYYSSSFVHFKELSSAQYEADHAPKNLKNITIEKKKVHTITKRKIETEIIKYKPKGLEQIIPF